MGCLVRAAPALFLHVNLLMMLFAGAMLATGARLKWDPTAYVPARELFPLEYGTAAALLPGAGLALALLAHLALAALRCRRLALRRVLLVVYASTMLVLVWCEVCLGGWVWWRVARWLRGPRSAELRHALALRDHLHPLLLHLAHYHPLPEKLDLLIKEAETDLPSNLYVLAGASGVLASLQALSAALALLAAHSAHSAQRRARSRDYSAHSTVTTSTPISSRRVDAENAPLKAVYKNGRLMMA